MKSHLKVEQHMDGLTIAFRNRNAGLALMAHHMLIGGGVGLGLAMMPTLLLLWPLSHLFVLIAVTAAAVVIGALLNQRHGGTADLLMHTVTVRGENLILDGWFTQRRIPLVDVVAFQQDGCVLITKENQALRLGAAHGDVARQELSNLLAETIASRPTGTAKDIPDSLRKLTDATVNRALSAPQKSADS